MWLSYAAPHAMDLMDDNHSTPDEERIYDLTEASLSAKGKSVLMLEDDVTLSRVLEE